MKNKNDYIAEVHKYEKNKIVYDKLLELGKIYFDTNPTNIINKQEIYKLSSTIIDELFNPMNLYSEALIPISFMKSTVGKVLFEVINDNRTITINELIEMSKTTENPKGYSYQYINKEIKIGRLSATQCNGRWEIEYEDAIKFLEKKKSSSKKKISEISIL